MKKTKKKGFTLVELLVVIAILAILATVSILGYTSFTKKAQISNDEAVMAQINLLLQAGEQVDKPATLHEALVYVRENGFDVTKLTPTADNHYFVYNQKDNRFEYETELKDLTANNWVLCDASEAAKKPYSVYLTGNSTNVTELTVNAGIDVGEVNNITTIIYDNSSAAQGQTVTIRTIGGNVTINAEKDIVNHYGTAVTLHVKAVAPDSYHEFGYINFAQVDKGNFEVENEGSVGVAYYETATATVKGNNIAIKLTENDTSAFTKTGDVVTLKYQAYVNNTGCNTVQDAVNAATNGQTIVLLSDVIGNVSIPVGKEVTIDFGGHTITSNNMNFGKAGFYNLGKVTLKNGIFTHEKPATGMNFYLIQNHGTMVMNDMTIIGHAESASMVMNGSDSGAGTKGELIINNCSLIQEGEFVALKNEFGTCIVNDSIISRENTDNVINAWNDITLNNCTVTGGIMFGNCLGKHTTLTINGGTYDCLHIHEWLYGANDTANLVIKDANFTNPKMKAAFGAQDKTKPVGERYSTTGTLDIEMTNTKMAADLSQWLAK